jgi:dephospho-CoA kinase
MNIIVMGHRQHGKGTFCNHARTQYGIESISSSLMACQVFLFDQLKDKYGYKTIEECFNDRDDKRTEWFEGILKFNTPDRGALSKLIFDKFHIYDGLRAKVEFDHLMKQGLIDLVIWIDASERMPLEPSTSITVTKKDAHVVITNNDTEEEFLKRIDATLKVVAKALQVS